MSISFCPSMTDRDPIGSSPVGPISAWSAAKSLAGPGEASVAVAAAPTNGWTRWVAGQVESLQIQICRSQEVELQFRQRAAFRAREFWYEDQNLHVEIQAEKLARNPGKTIAQLKMTPAGCDWLIRRWQTLGQTAPVDWTEDQKTLASHLAGQTYEAGATPGCSPAAAIATLRACRVRVEAADAMDRSLVQADLSDALGPDFARIRRCTQSLFTRLRFFLGLLAHESPSLATPAELLPIPVSPTPVSPAETKPPEIVKTKPIEIARTKPIEPEPAAEVVYSQPVAIRSSADRQRRTDLQQARKRQRQARRRQS